MSVITISSGFGTGGSVVASRIAAQLDWKLVNRLIPEDVASSLAVPLEAALAKDEASESRIGRLFARLSVSIAPQGAVGLPAEAFLDEESFRRRSEAFIRTTAESSNCVIVGRASAIVLADHAAALHVRLGGDPERRAIQAANALSIPLAESVSRLIETDRARAMYVKHFYGRDWADPSLYHLVLDSTALSLDACTEIILTAASDRFAHGDVGAVTEKA